MKRILSMILSISMIAGILVTPAFAAPIDKITADDVFMAIFDPVNAVDLGYEPGQKAAVAIPSNSHYADYASEGFWFVWGGDKDLGSLVSAKQKDTGFAVLANFFFDKYESLTITVKSSNEYREVTFTEPGTYFIDQFLLKNEKKGAAGGYHNINWIGVSMKEKTHFSGDASIILLKLLQKGTADPVIWDYEHEFFDDNDYIYFDLYNDNDGVRGNNLLDTAKVNGINGQVVFNNLEDGAWYWVSERIDLNLAIVNGYNAEGIARLESYIESLPYEIRVQAKEETLIGVLPGFVEEDWTSAGIKTQRDVIISTDKDDALSAYECRNAYRDYLEAKTDIVAWGDNVKYWAGNNYAKYMKDEMMRDANNADIFFDDVGSIHFEANSENYYPQFVWNTDNFGDNTVTAASEDDASKDLWDLKLYGNTVIFEKSFTLLDEIDNLQGGKFYIAGDDAFLIYVNGNLAGWSNHLNHQNLVLGSVLNENVLTNIIGDRGDVYIETKGGDEWTWKHVYDFDILNFLNAGVENTITVVGINRADIQSPASWNNPAAFIFGCEIFSYSEGYRFVNKLPGDEPAVFNAIVDFSKMQLVDGILVGFENNEKFDFKLFKIVDGVEILLNTYTTELDLDGIGKVEVNFGNNLTEEAARALIGEYVFREVALDGWNQVTYTNGLYFDLVITDGKLEVLWVDLEESEIETPIVVNVELGALEAIANVIAQHDKITYEPVYEDLWTENTTNTLVSYVNANSDFTWGNGHTFVKVNVAEAMSGDGVWYGIAPSNKTNEYIGYSYNVKIEGNKLIISFDENFRASGIIHAKAFISPPTQTPPGQCDKFSNVQPGAKLEISMPTGYGDDIYLFLHIADGIQWYTGEKKIVSYEETGKVTVTDTYTGTLTVTLKDEEGNTVGSKSISNNGSVTFENLASGDYTCILSGDGFNEKEETVTIAAGETARVTFSLTVTYPDVELGKNWEIGTIIPKPTTFSAPLVSGYNFVQFVNIVEEPVPLAVITADNEPDTEETETVETETVEDDEEAVSEETKAIIPEEDESSEELDVE